MPIEEQKKGTSWPGKLLPVSRESLHNFLISFDRLIASKTFACRVFYGQQTAPTDGRTETPRVEVEVGDGDGDGDECPRGGFRLRRTANPCSRDPFNLYSALQTTTAATFGCQLQLHLQFQLQLQLGQVCRFWRPRHQHQLPPNCSCCCCSWSPMAPPSPRLEGCSTRLSKPKSCRSLPRLATPLGHLSRLKICEASFLTKLFELGFFSCQPGGENKVMFMSIFWMYIYNL